MPAALAAAAGQEICNTAGSRLVIDPSFGNVLSVFQGSISNHYLSIFKIGIKIRNKYLSEASEFYFYARGSISVWVENCQPANFEHLWRTEKIFWGIQTL